MDQALANVAVVATTVGTIAFLVPQISKLIRTEDSAGVSTTWAALGLVTNAGCPMLGRPVASAFAVTRHG